MGGTVFRAIMLSVLFLLSSQFHLSTPILSEERLPFLANQEAISSTEIRIHNLGGEWNDSQVIEWSPNHLDYNRTIQFSVLIEGINSSESIESLTLNMTWIYNVSSGDSLLSENLSKLKLIPNENGLFMFFNYTYPLDIFHDEYVITLDTIESDGTLHRFEHKGINVVAYDMHLVPTTMDFYDKLLFANDQVTALELLIQNTGSVYTDVEYQINILTQLPSNWNFPNIFISDRNLSGGQNSLVLIEFLTPSNAYPSKNPLPNIIFQLVAEFEDFTGQMVEFYNVNYSLESEIVPVDSIVNISMFRSDYGVDLIKNNFQQIDSSANSLEYSLVSIDNQSIEFFFEVKNFGFSLATFELGVASVNSVELEIFSSSNNEKSLDLDGDDGVFRDIGALESVSFRCKIDFISQSQSSKDPVIITVINSESGMIFEIDLPIQVLEIESIFYPALQLEFSEPPEYLSILQNDSLEFFLIMQWNPIFEVSYFTNQWKIDISFTDLEFSTNPLLELSLMRNNSSLQSPHEFAIDENQFFRLIIDVDKEALVGNYSMEIEIEQINDGIGNRLTFESQFEFSVLENSSLIEPSHNNSNGNSTDDSIIDPSNNSANNSDNTNIDNQSTNSSNPLVNNSQNITDNITNNTLQVNDNGTENKKADLNDSVESKSSNFESWFLVSMLLIIISFISVIIIRRKISPKELDVEVNQAKEIVEITSPNNSIMPIEVPGTEDLTVINQWTDNNGYTWKQMSDRSMLWWNGQEWVPVNYK